jgi:hypothetical protein
MSVWQKQKNWWNEVLWKPKKALSLDQLKYACGIHTKERG